MVEESTSFNLDFTSRSGQNPGKITSRVGDNIEISSDGFWEVALYSMNKDTNYDTLHNKYGRPIIDLRLKGHDSVTGAYR